MPSKQNDLRPITPLRQPGHAAYIEFGQEKIASDIVKLLEIDYTISVALTGEYGSGKSEVLDKVAQRINTQGCETWHIVRYEPWKYAPNSTTLRRTFLNKILSDTPECDNKPSLLAPRPKTISIDESQPIALEPMRLLKNLQYPSITFGIICILAIVLWLLTSWIASFVAIDITVGFAVVLAFAVAIATAFGDKLARQTVNLHFRPVVRSEETKTIEIDDFEGNYAKTLKWLKKLNGDDRLIVLVDDLDRCREDEIKSVLTGLATYLGRRATDDEAPVSFVVALDAQRMEAILSSTHNANWRGNSAEKPESRIFRRYNIIGKYFDAIIPVPIPPLDKWKQIMIHQARELNWNIDPLKVDRMARVAAVNCRFNLRELQSTIIESQMIRWHWGSKYEHLDKNIKGILQDDLLLFSAALLRVSVPADELYRFLQGPLERAVGGLDSEMENLIMEFEDWELDPRPVLAMGIPSYDVLHLEDLPRIADAFKDADDASYEELCPVEDLNPDISLRVAYYSIRQLDPVSGQVRQQNRLDTTLLRSWISRLEELLEKAIPALEKNQEEIEVCIEWYGSARFAIIKQNKPTDEEIDRWSRIAYFAGTSVLLNALESNKLLSAKNYLPVVTSNVCRLIATDGAAISDRLGRAGAVVVACRNMLEDGVTPKRITECVEDLDQLEEVAKVTDIGWLIVEVLGKWDAQETEIPSLFLDSRAVEAIKLADAIVKAHSIYVRFANLDEPHEFFELMTQHGWEAFGKEADDRNGETGDAQEDDK